MTEKRNYRKPVAWLGGRDLIANLKYFLLFAAFKGKLDPRDWMRPEVFPPDDPKLEGYAGRFHNSFKGLLARNEFWFDYFADSGDGMTAGYAIAYLCLSDLQVRLAPNWETLTAKQRREILDRHSCLTEIRSRLGAGEKPSRIAVDYEGIAPQEILDRLKKNENRAHLIKAIEESAVGVIFTADQRTGVVADGLELPRGAFLFVGGDTAYHVADFAGLGLRFQQVFDWAYADLKTNLAAAHIDTEDYLNEDNRRPIFGVPGNHDYYDMIDGFNRQFARSITRESRFINLAGRNLPPQLRLWPFRRFQTASYVAIKLPFDWWFWGVDSELKRVDLRQQEFFKRTYALSLRGHELQKLKNEVTANLKAELMARGIDRDPTPEEFDRRFPRVFQTGLGNVWKMPSKLIVATSEPTTVEGKRGLPEDKTPMAFSFLDITRPFLYAAGKRGSQTDQYTLKDREAIRALERQMKLAEFRCRLDISGDVHHYARYWGDDSLDGHDGAVAESSYASVVSGGGGASMSPTQTDYDEVEEQALYPSKENSQRVVNRSLFNPLVVVRGGNVWLAGAIIAAIVFFGAGYIPSHAQFTNSVADFIAATLHSVFHLPVARVEHEANLHEALDSAWKTLKPILLLLLSAGSVLGSGLYARWLFQRLTMTYDWGSDRLLNLQLEGFRDEAKEKEYGRLLDEIKGQTSKVRISKIVACYVFFILSFLLTLAMWVFEGNPIEEPKTRYLVFGGFLAAFVALIIVSTLVSRKRYNGFVTLAEKFNETLRQEIKTGTPQTIAEVREQVHQVRQYSVTSSHDYLPFWGLFLFPGVANFAFTLWRYSHLEKTGLPEFGVNALILLSFVLAVTTAVVAMYYSKWLFDQAYRIKVNWYSFIPVGCLSTSALIFIGAAIWSFAQHAGRLIIADNLYLLSLIAVPAGCVALAMLVGNHVATWPRRIVFFLLGAWHGILQLYVPLLLVWLGSAKAFFWALLTALLVAVFCVWLISHLRVKHVGRLINPVVMPLIWLLYGAWMILIPFLMPRPRPGFHVFANWWRISILANLALAAGVGALMCCVWLGWYFAVSLVFDGHANEAGSTARTEGYKQFIRFRLTKDTLTGFVIGLDFPRAPAEGETEPKLKPRLIDVFTLKCGPPPEPT